MSQAAGLRARIGLASALCAFAAAAVLAIASMSVTSAQAAVPSPSAPPAVAQPPRGRPEPVVPVTPAATAEELAAGNFTATRKAERRYTVVVAGTMLSTRAEVETYMLFRAAQFALQNGYSWFELVEARSRGDKVPALVRDPEGPRFSFRIPHWRPVWRLKAEGSNDWRTWSPFSGDPFPVEAGGKVAAYEVTADIVLHKGMTDGVNPLAFEADALVDFLLYQVKPAR